MSVDTHFVLSVFRNEYNNRLHEVIGEADVFDEDGNLILSPDLKVRHKGSGLEYTIDHVEDADGGVEIHLRSPETPRFDPPAEEKEILGEPPTDDLLGEQDTEADPAVASTDLAAEEEAEVMFVVDQEEFEKDYEVD